MRKAFVLVWCVWAVSARSADTGSWKLPLSEKAVLLEDLTAKRHNFD